MKKNDWLDYKKPSQVSIVCENNDKSMTAEVISLSEKMLVAAIQGVKITLVDKNGSGTYTGKMGGLDLVYKSKK